MKIDEDKLWRWIVRLSGLAGIAYGTLLDQTLPQFYLIIFAAMIGLPEFIKSRGNGGT